MNLSLQNNYFRLDSYIMLEVIDKICQKKKTCFVYTFANGPKKGKL